VKLAEAEALDIVRHEVTAMRALDDCRYVALFDDDMAFDQETLIVHLYVDYSFKPECTLAQFIEASKFNINKEMVAVLINTLAKALVDCHAKGFYHPDVRPSNSEFFFCERQKRYCQLKSRSYLGQETFRRVYASCRVLDQLWISQNSGGRLSLFPFF
jgi:serine/threonine protein kinase